MTRETYMADSNVLNVLVSHLSHHSNNVTVTTTRCDTGTLSNTMFMGIYDKVSNHQVWVFHGDVHDDAIRAKH